MLTKNDAAQGFSALGSVARIDVLMTLVRAGGTGRSFGALQDKTGIPASTLAHHLGALVAAGLVEQEKVGRSTISRACFDQLRSLSSFFLENCCLDEVERSAEEMLGDASR